MDSCPITKFYVEIKNVTEINSFRNKSNTYNLQNEMSNNIPFTVLPQGQVQVKGVYRIHKDIRCDHCRVWLSRYRQTLVHIFQCLVLLQNSRK